jgi:hypothetical protein
MPLRPTERIIIGKGNLLGEFESSNLLFPKSGERHIRNPSDLELPKTQPKKACGSLPVSLEKCCKNM